ncbi:MAG: fibronectin type III domain-containing protein [Thermoanaerobaculia bacterium]
MKTSILSFLLLLSTSLFAATPDNHAKTSFTQVGPVAASNGSDFFVAWSDRTLETPALNGRTILVDGPREESVGTQLADSHRSDTRDVAFGDTLYLAVWADGGDLLGAFILPSGVKLATFPIHSSFSDYAGASVVWDGHRFFVVWSQDGRIQGAFVSSDGSVSQAQRLSSDPATNDNRPQRFPDVAWNGTQFLLGWSSYIDGSVDPRADFQIDSYVRLIAADGTPAGDTLFLQSDIKRLHIASNNADFFVVMQSIDSVTGIGVRNQGGALTTDPTVTTIFNWVNMAGANVAFDGADYVIAVRYGLFRTPGASWLATSHVRHSGPPFQQRVIAIGPFDNFEDPAIASNTPGTILLATSFTRPDAEVPHVYTYLESELQEMPAAPAAPTNVSAIRLPNGEAFVSWSATPDARGFVVETRSANDKSYSAQGTEPADARSAAISAATESVRVRAVGAGGISEPSVAVTLRNVGRRRAASH